MSWKLQNFQPLDLTSKLTLSDDGWDSISIYNGRAYVVNRYPNKWMKSNIDGQGNLTDFKPLDLSSHLISIPDEWEAVVFRNDKAYFVNWRTAYWYTADVDSNGDFSNFVRTDMSGLLIGYNNRGWVDIVFLPHKVIFVNSWWNKSQIANIPNNWNGDLKSLTNFKSLDFTNKLEDSYETVGLTIRDGKALFTNVDANQCSTANVTDDGVFSNFQAYDLSQDLTTSPANWDTATFHGNKAIFANTNRSKWMTADIVYEAPTTGGGGTVSPTPTPTVDTNAWHYGGVDGGPHPTKNDWKGSFSSHSKQVEFEAVVDEVNDDGFRNETNLKAISLPFATKIGTYSFFGSDLTEIALPKVYSIGNNALSNTVNAQITQVTLPDLFDTDADKNRIFGDHQWQRITFHWLHDTLPPNSIWWNGEFQDTQFEMDGEIVEKIIWLNGPTTTIKPTDSFTITSQAGSSTDPIGFTIDETKKFTQFGSDLVLEPTIDTYGNHAVYTKKELNDWLANSNSVSGNVVANDGRVGHGDYPSVASSNIAIEFKEVDGKRIITRVFLKTESKVYEGFANNNMLSTFTVDNGGGEELRECILKPLIVPAVDFKPNSGTWRLLDMESSLTEEYFWYDIVVNGNKALLLNNESSLFVEADIDSLGNLSNFQRLDLSSKLTSNSSGWRGAGIYKNKIYFINLNEGASMVADIDDSLNMTNFTNLNLAGGNWMGIVFFKDKACLVNAVPSAWATVDIKSDGSLTNEQHINLGAKLTTSSYSWISMKINNGKVYFVNENVSKWMTADIPDLWDVNPVNLINFQRLDLSSKVTGISSTQIFFSSGSAIIVGRSAKTWFKWTP